MELGINELPASAAGDPASRHRGAKTKMSELSRPANDPRLPELPVMLSNIQTSEPSPRTGNQGAAKPRLLTFDLLPFIERSSAGEPVRGLAIDRWAYTNGGLLIAGWVIGVGDEYIGANAVAGMPEVPLTGVTPVLVTAVVESGRTGWQV